MKSLWIFLILLTSLLWAPLASAALLTEDQNFIAMAGYGLDVHAERDQQQNVVPRSWNSIILGAGFKPWMALFEYSSFTENSGNETLSVARKTESALFWFQWHAEDAWTFKPFFGIGYGGYRETTDSTFYTTVRSDESAWTEYLGGAIGLRWANVSPVWVSLEARVYSSKYLDPNPMLGALLRIGFVLE